MPFAYIAMTIRSLDVARAYDIVKIMTDGGPAGRTELLWTLVGAHRLQRRADGHGQRHGLCLDPAVDRLHRLFLPQARRGPHPDRSGVVMMDRQRCSTALDAPAAGASPICIGLFLAMLVICLPGLWIVLSARCGRRSRSWRKPPVWIPQELSLDAYRRHVRRASGKGGIPVWDYFRNSLIISVTSTVDRARHRHGGRLCLRALPLPRQVGACSSA